MNDRYKEWCDTILSGNFEVWGYSSNYAIKDGIYRTWATGMVWGCGNTTYYIRFIDGIFLPTLDWVGDVELRGIINSDEEIKNKVMEKIRIYML